MHINTSKIISLWYYLYPSYFKHEFIMISPIQIHYHIDNSNFPLILLCKSPLQQWETWLPAPVIYAANCSTPVFIDSSIRNNQYPMENNFVNFSTQAMYRCRYTFSFIKSTQHLFIFGFAIWVWCAYTFGLLLVCWGFTFPLLVQLCYCSKIHRVSFPVLNTMRVTHGLGFGLDELVVGLLRKADRARLQPS